VYISSYEWISRVRTFFLLNQMYIQYKIYQFPRYKEHMYNTIYRQIILMDFDKIRFHSFQEHKIIKEN
jgi:hypothetical protein